MANALTPDNAYIEFGFVALDTVKDAPQKLLSAIGAAMLQAGRCEIVEPIEIHKQSDRTVSSGKARLIRD